MSLSNLDDVTNKACIVLSELDRPVFPNLTPEGLNSVQTLLLHSEETLWVATGAYKSCINPAANMASGLFRTVRSETAAKAATLDLDPDSTLSDMSRAELILGAFERLFHSVENEEEDLTPAIKYAEQAGHLVVPRIIADGPLNEHIHRELHPSTAGPYLQPLSSQPPRLLQLDIETPGALDTLYFRDAPNPPTIPDNELEIRVAATGINFKDALTAMGQLPHPGHMGLECAGVVTRVSKAVAHLFALGDRVCAMTSAGVYSTLAQCPASSAARIPDAMVFEEAASLPVVFGTAYYGLVELARLAAGGWGEGADSCGGWGGLGR